MTKVTDIIHKEAEDLTRAEALFVAQALLLYLEADKEDADSYDKLTIKLKDGREVTYIDKMRMNIIDGENVVLMAEVAEMTENYYYERVFKSVGWSDDKKKIEVVNLLSDDDYKNVLMKYAQEQQSSKRSRKERFTKSREESEKKTSSFNLPPL